MSDKLKNHLLDASNEVIAIGDSIRNLGESLFAATGEFFENEAPEPVPDPVPLPDPLPDPIYNPDLVLMRGEIDGFWLKEMDTTRVEFSEGLDIKLYVVDNAMTHTVPSYKGARVGAYPDPLIEGSTDGENGEGSFLEVKGLSPGKHTVVVDGVEFRVLVLTTELPTRPALKSYTEIKGTDITRAIGLEDHLTNWGEHKRVIAMLREHRIEPIKQAVVNYNIDIDRHAEFNCSFRQLVLEGAIAPPCVFYPNPSTPPGSVFLDYIESLIRSGELPADSWAYVWDEGQAHQLPQLLARLDMIDEQASSLHLMATWEMLNELRTRLDHAGPVLDWVGRAVPASSYTRYDFAYTSCMAQGNCQNNSNPRPPSGTPMMVVDSPRIHQRAFPVVCWQLGFGRSLYYKADLMLKTAYTDQYNEGGHGDGTLFYVNGGQVVPSLRLKYWRRGINDCEYLSRLGPEAPTLARSSFDWSKDENDYLEMRKQYARKIGEL